MKRLDAWLGEPVTAEFETAMARWWDEHAANREANVHPDASEFGLDLDAVRDSFAGYTSRIPGWIGAVDIEARAPLENQME